MKKKKELNILERHMMERQKIYAAQVTSSALLLLCAFTGSDFICFTSFSEILFNENPVISILVSLIGAVGLDVSSFAAGLVVSTPVPLTVQARKNRIVKVVLYFMCFLICYIGLIYFAATVASQTDSDIFADGTLFRVLLPAATSLLSFALGWRTDCTTPMIRLLDRQIAELEEEIDIIDTNCLRMRTAFEKYDPDSYDREMYLSAVDRLEAQMNMAGITIAEAMVAEFGKYEAPLNAFLGESTLYDPAKAIRRLRDYEPEICPSHIHHSGDIPEINEATEENKENVRNETSDVHIHQINSVA